MATQDMLATLLGTVQDPGRKRELDDQMQNQKTAQMFANASNPFQAMQASGAMGIQKSANNRDSVLQGGRRATNSGEFEVPALMKKAVQAVQARGISQARDPKAFFTAMAEETGKSPQLLPISMKFGEELSKITTAEESGRVKRAELGLKERKQIVDEAAERRQTFNTASQIDKRTADTDQTKVETGIKKIELSGAPAAAQAELNAIRASTEKDAAATALTAEKTKRAKEANAAGIGTFDAQKVQASAVGATGTKYSGQFANMHKVWTDAGLSQPEIQANMNKLLLSKVARGNLITNTADGRTIMFDPEKNTFEEIGKFSASDTAKRAEKAIMMQQAINMVDAVLNAPDSVLGFIGTAGRISGGLIAYGEELGSRIPIVKDIVAKGLKSLQLDSLGNNVDQAVIRELHTLDVSELSIPTIEKSLAYMLARAQVSDGRLTNLAYRTALTQVKLQGWNTSSSRVKESLSVVRSIFNNAFERLQAVNPDQIKDKANKFKPKYLNISKAGFTSDQIKELGTLKRGDTLDLEDGTYILEMDTNNNRKWRKMRLEE
jgi:hypothetical protein